MKKPVRALKFPWLHSCFGTTLFSHGCCGSSSSWLLESRARSWDNQGFLSEMRILAVQFLLSVYSGEDEFCDPELLREGHCLHALYPAGFTYSCPVTVLISEASPENTWRSRRQIHPIQSDTKSYSAESPSPVKWKHSLEQKAFDY